MLPRFLKPSLVLIWPVVSFCQTVAAPQPGHDFGTIKQGERVTHAYSIKNTGDAPLVIQKIDLNAPGITTRFRPEIAPGAEANVTLEWNTARASGETEAEAVVFTNDRKQPQIVLRAKANVIPPIEFVPFPAVFFAAYRDEAPEKSVRIVNHETDPLHIERVEAPPDRFEVALKEIKPGTEFELRVKVRPGQPLSRSTTPIYLYTNRPARPRLQVNANLFVKADLYAFPEDVNFGTVKISDLQKQPKLLDLLTQTTVITNRGGKMELQQVTSDIPNLRITRSQENGASEKVLLKVDLIPGKLAPGPLNGKITVKTNAPNQPELVISVRGKLE